MFSIEQTMMQLSCLVADDLHLVFLPAEHRFLDQHFGGRRGVEAALDDLEELLAVVGDAAAGAAEGEGRADDRRQADDRRAPSARRPASGRARSAASPGRSLVIASRNSSRSSALSMASAVAPIISTPNFSRTPILRSDSAVLSAVWPPMVGSSQRVGRAARSFSMILATISGRDRLDIGGVGQVRVGHDRRRIGIDQDDPVALVLQRLAGLGAGIVELAGLADDDRPGADDEDRLDVGALRHGLAGTSRRTKPRRGSRPGRSSLGNLKARPAL